MDKDAEQNAIRDTLDAVAEKDWPPTEEEYRSLINQLGEKRNWSVQQCNAALKNVLDNLEEDCWCDGSCGDEDCCGGPWQSVEECETCLRRYAIDAAEPGNTN